MCLGPERMWKSWADGGGAEGAILAEGRGHGTPVNPGVGDPVSGGENPLRRP